jgi:hypothetical protein
LGRESKKLVPPATRSREEHTISKIAGFSKEVSIVRDKLERRKYGSGSDKRTPAV